ncbi:GDP-fucose protein O-fucosyltransferase 1 isoform X1 [Dendroctonus ponderosae]|uniref:GDP-fucose protein O-fucosyltransferase 1 isoform X1 n=1 Tax=Dendroctonus ponderosae TaxID=77166 RepID=UPI002034C829|nr:GDP-fucose protein O-fucosyltransferase 1 isoform X1 [Dendroctonus ponderosae]
MALLYVLSILIVYLIQNSVSFDPSGYMVYCPCMGRFGNQADHFLGSLAFAKALNRTLVLPPWIEYRYGERLPKIVPFSTYFTTAPLLEFHKVIPMKTFMDSIAPYEWPSKQRVVFCYMARGKVLVVMYKSTLASPLLLGDSKSCNAKEGNPFGAFWDSIQVDFVDSEFYGPLHHDVSNEDIVKKWKEIYPPDKWPVLAFTGAPASFPVADENRHIHKHLVWSKDIEDKAKKFLSSRMPKGAFIGIHLRNGVDWVRACKHIPESPNLFAAPQCLGYRNEKGNATAEMCLPSKEQIVKQLKKAIKNMNDLAKVDSHKTVRAVFVASDNHHMIEELRSALHKLKVTVVKLNTPDPHVDLAILGKSNVFIGNCISSFSAFVKRERDSRGAPSLFWGFPVTRSRAKYRDEL